MNYRRQSPSFKHEQTSHQLTHSIICSLFFFPPLFPWHEKNKIWWWGGADCPDCPTFKKQTNCVFRQPLRLWGHYYYYFFFTQWMSQSKLRIYLYPRANIYSRHNSFAKEKQSERLNAPLCMFVFFPSFFVISKLSFENPGACARVQDRPRPPRGHMVHHQAAALSLDFLPNLSYTLFSLCL